MGEWTTLSVKQSTVEHLKESKPEDMSWNEFLYGVTDDGEIAESAGEPRGNAIDEELAERLKRIESAASTAEERTGRIERQVEELQR